MESLPQEIILHICEYSGYMKKSYGRDGSPNIWLLYASGHKYAWLANYKYISLRVCYGYLFVASVNINGKYSGMNYYFTDNDQPQFEGYFRQGDDGEHNYLISSRFSPFPRKINDEYYYMPNNCVGITYGNNATSCNCVICRQFAVITAELKILDPLIFSLDFKNTDICIPRIQPKIPYINFDTNNLKIYGTK